MDPLTLAAPLLYGTVLALLVAAGLRPRRGAVKVWREAAAAAKLTEVRQTNGFRGSSLQGRAGALGVTLETCEVSGVSGTRIAFSGLGGGDLLLRREEALTVVGQRLAHTRGFAAGARQFDSEVDAQGSSATLTAILDARTRHRVLRLLRDGRLVVSQKRKRFDAVVMRPSVAKGILQLEVASGRYTDFVAVFLATLDLARRLVEPADVPARIAENLRSERNPHVRLRELLTLAREFPDDASTREAQAALLADPSDEVRLRAAIGLGDGGLEALRTLVADSEASDSCAARAVEALGTRLSAEDLETALHRALADDRGDTAAACLEALGRAEEVPAQDARRPRKAADKARAAERRRA